MHEIEKLYREKFNPSVKLMSRILQGDWHGGQDVVQEAFTRAWEYYPSFDPDRGKINVWFNAILFNALRDYQKETRIGPQNDAEDFSVNDILNELNISNFEEKRDYLAHKISWVQNPNHKEVLRLFFMLGYTSTEISKIVPKMSQTNVTTIVTRFKERIMIER